MKKYKPHNLKEFRDKALIYASSFRRVFNSDSNNITFPNNPFDDLLAFSSSTSVPFSNNNNFQELKAHIDRHQCWLFGHFSYDLKNQIEKLNSTNTNHLEFPDVAFFEPEHLLKFHGDHVEFIVTDDAENLIKKINQVRLTNNGDLNKSVKTNCNVSKEEYIEVVNRLKDHILEGDIYEINYCIQFLVENLRISPANFFLQLSASSPAPFSSFYKLDEKYMIGASPERYLKKSQQQLISQPIKGTARRGKTPGEDETIKKNLRANEKELAENMMIVDLVRNDLARSCTPGTVVVDEMFGIYTFTHLHQMISTIKGSLKSDVHLVDAIKNSFPMGSMTGAPKIKVMELIEQYEKAKRGLYSGAVGYFTPEGDFDFNVVIRSLLYDEKESLATFQVGSAITYDADPEYEYDECLLKASAIQKLLRSI